MKNNVSYFLEGFKNGLIESGKYTREEIEHIFYTTIELPNKALKLMREYDELQE